MASTRKGILPLGIALLALSASVIALSADHPVLGDERVRPPEVQPESEAPTAAELARRSLAIPQPSGTLDRGHGPIAPVIANPQR